LEEQLRAVLKTIDRDIKKREREAREARLAAGEEEDGEHAVEDAEDAEEEGPTAPADPSAEVAGKILSSALANTKLI